MDGGGLGQKESVPPRQPPDEFKPAEGKAVKQAADLPNAPRPPAPPALHPLSVNELVKRIPKNLKQRKPHFTLKPNEVKRNYIAEQQQVLEKQVRTMAWSDEPRDILNPVHPYNGC